MFEYLVPNLVSDLARKAEDECCEVGYLSFGSITDMLVRPKRF